MKIQVISPITNPLFSAAATQAYVEKARPDVEISNVHLDRGPASIETLYETEIAAPQVVTRAIEAERRGADAVIIDCMNDPGLDAARECVSIPVVGAAQASMMMASILSHTFSIIGTAARDRYPNELLVRRYGLQAKYASTRCVDIPVLDLHKNEEQLLQALIEAARAAIRRDGAQAIVFGCTGMRALAKKVEQALRRLGLPAPVIEPSSAALKWAEMLVDLRLSPSRRTYPLVTTKLLDEHRIAMAPPVPGEAGRLDNRPHIYILTPVIQGDRPDRWLEDGQRDYLRFARPGTQITVRAIRHGPYSIETLYDKAMAIPDMLRLARQAERDGASAAIIDCMSDPSLDAAREAVSIPVVGPAQTSAFVAASLAHRFTVIGTLSHITHKFARQIEEYGIAGRLASVRGLGLSVRELESDLGRTEQAFIKQAELAATQDGAHAIIPGCTGMIGLAAKLQASLAARGIDIPVIEPAAAAVKMAEAFSDLGLAHSKITYPLPFPKELPGYSDLEFSAGH